MAILAFCASFFTFASLVLEIFTLIGNTYNRPFLRNLYFAKLFQNNRSVQFGLWNSCSGQGGYVTECTHPQPAYVWSNAEGLSGLVDGLNGHDKLFLANFILYWIAFGLTLFALVITLLSNFRRSSDLLASFACFIAFVVMLVVFIIVLVISLRGINAAKGVDSSISGFLGPSTWMTLGAMVGLLLASLWYCFACCCGSGRRVRDADKA
ncbi:actin cortical patch SUR7/pH-response regulator pali [Radiomyces spectabilis]|uniref:actin cortical patch SUR7/pH-response regulator pali n=1 Tax=Radiomyces spectabilis TaxID=64574 RepID=UPI002220BD69|nr:actin cortical patch SUR7/pH-response regulator pali [Radiomyces spectabilis]KAI8374203.1 actin cortical patch SUR7/pH-response regulator pali [Radiomyces spectabilis]